MDVKAFEQIANHLGPQLAMRCLGGVKPIKIRRWIKKLAGECAYCDEHRDDEMMPPHDASPYCESGKHNHCTCDACFGKRG